MIIIKRKQYLVLLVCMCLYVGVSSSDEVTSSTRDIFNELGINQDQFTSAVETTSRAIQSWELRDVVSAGSIFLQLWMKASQSKSDSSSSEARQHGGGYKEMFDPVLGFALLGGIVFAALVAWLAYILASAERKKRDLTSGAMSALSPDTTAYILGCIANAENSFSCLTCVAITDDGSKCFR